MNVLTERARNITRANAIIEIEEVIKDKSRGENVNLPKKISAL